MGLCQRKYLPCIVTETCLHLLDVHRSQSAHLPGGLHPGPVGRHLSGRCYILLGFPGFSWGVCEWWQVIMSDVLLYFFINMWSSPNFNLFWHVTAFNHSSLSLLSNRSASKTGNLVHCSLSSYNFIIYTPDWIVVINWKNILPELKVVEPESELGGSVLSNAVPRKLVPLPCSPLVDISTLDQLDHVGKLGFQIFILLLTLKIMSRCGDLYLQYCWINPCCYSPAEETVPLSTSGSGVVAEPRPAPSFLKITVPDQTSPLTVRHSDKGCFFVFLNLNAEVLVSCLLCNHNDPVPFSWFERDRASTPWLLPAFYFPFQDLHSWSGKAYSKITR